MNDYKKDISDSLIDLITSLNKKIFDPSEPAKRFSMPHSHVRVLFYLKKFGPVPISQVAKDLDILRSNMTPIIDKLIAEDFVRRHNDPSDRRVIKVEITNKADELFKRHVDYLKEAISSKISSLSNEDLSKLYELILEMASIISKLD